MAQKYEDIKELLKNHFKTTKQSYLELTIENPIVLYCGTCVTLHGVNYSATNFIFEAWDNNEEEHLVCLSELREAHKEMALDAVEQELNKIYSSK
jgi:late competence protein required for DNA uptake (superfamily II DNA/RNA helicase)